MHPPGSDLCPTPLLSEALDSLASDEGADETRLDALIAAHPRDPRLHFLRGSVQAGAGRYAEALASLRKAVEIDPHYRIARFQLGLFEATCGEVEAAARTLSPLAGGEDGLSCFAEGLLHLIHDELPAAVECLRRGIARNRDCPPINRDMKLIVDRIEADAGGRTPARSASAVQALLREYETRPTGQGGR